MRKLFGVLFALGTGLCIWWRNHKPERRLVGQHGGFRCPDCGRVGRSLDDFVPGGGAGFVRTDRRVYDRRAGSVERDSHRREGENR